MFSENKQTPKIKNEIPELVQFSEEGHYELTPFLKQKENEAKLWVRNHTKRQARKNKRACRPSPIKASKKRKQYSSQKTESDKIHDTPPSYRDILTPPPSLNEP